MASEALGPQSTSCCRPAKLCTETQDTHTMPVARAILPGADSCIPSSRAAQSVTKVLSLSHNSPHTKRSQHERCHTPLHRTQWAGAMYTLLLLDRRPHPALALYWRMHCTHTLYSCCSTPCCPPAAPAGCSLLTNVTLSYCHTGPSLPRNTPDNPVNRGAYESSDT